MTTAPDSFISPNGQMQTEDEFFAYTKAPEAVATRAANKGKEETETIAFWAAHWSIDLAEAGALEKIAAKRAETAKHFAEFDDQDN